MTRLLLWRHGRTQWNATDRVQGQSDVGLDDTGLAQARAAAPVLAGYRPSLIVSSDLRRAADTAAALAELTGLAVDLDPRLRERHYGPWQGLTLAEVARRFPDDYRRWREGTPLRDPAIESVDAVMRRTGAALREVAARVGDQTAVVVTHGNAARSATAALLGWSSEVMATLAGLGNCHFTELAHTATRGWQLRGHNLGSPPASEGAQPDLAVPASEGGQPDLAVPASQISGPGQPGVQPSVAR